PSHFGRLDTLVLGDTLTITDPNGNLYEYEVVNISRLHQSENEKLLDRAPWDLTLYTCDNSNRTYRTVIRCQRL
ncbi:MAG: sortase, partial [Eubacteriales bacterium]